MKLEKGDRGEYSVVVDGETIASRGGSFVVRLIGGGWPDEDEVLTVLAERRDAG